MCNTHVKSMVSIHQYYRYTIDDENLYLQSMILIDDDILYVQYIY